MSNTSTVTPYSSEAGSGSAVAVAAGGITCAAAVAGIAIAAVRWLREETLDDRQAVDTLEQARRRERIGVDIAREPVRAELPAASLTSQALHVRELEPLVRTAEALGYRRERQPVAMRSSRDLILLRGHDGQRIAIERTTNGALALHTAGGVERLQTLMHRHTLQGALAQLKAEGFFVEMRTTAGGRS